MHSLEAKGGESPKKLLITGEVVSEYAHLDLAIGQYTMNLKESPFFARVEPPTIERDIYSPVPKANFQIVCELKI